MDPYFRVGGKQSQNIYWVDEEHPEGIYVGVFFAEAVAAAVVQMLNASLGTRRSVLQISARDMAIVKGQPAPLRMLVEGVIVEEETSHTLLLGASAPEQETHCGQDRQDQPGLGEGHPQGRQH